MEGTVSQPGDRNVNAATGVPQSGGSPGAGRQFEVAFARFARAVRARRLSRHLLTGLTFGLFLAVIGAGAAWWWRADELRLWALTGAAIGLVGGLANGLRQRWSDARVALFLDARLAGNETLTTAVELTPEASAGSSRTGAAAAVHERAARLLAGKAPGDARPRVLERRHAAAPLALAAVVGIALAPLPPAPPEPPPEPGRELVHAGQVAGLEKLEGLDDLDARDPAQRARLDAIARDAKKLREELAKGLEKREALARVAKLRDRIDAERMKLGDKTNRAGLDAAVKKLGQDDRHKAAAKALGDGDLTRFDEEMRKLANLAEKDAREAAKKALEEAAEAARKRGAKDVEKLLGRQKEAFEKEQAKAEALRELAEGLRGKLSPEALKDLEEFGATGDPKARQRLGKALADALDKLSDEEKKRLKERLQQRMGSGKSGNAPSPLTDQQLRQLARQLGSKGGKKALEDALKDLARPEASPDAKRQQGLNDADRGGARAQQGLGMPMPAPAPGGGGKQPGGSGQQPGGGGKQPGGSGRQPGGSGKSPAGGKATGKGGPGSGNDTGTGNHDGKTDRITSPELRSKADPRFNASAPMRGSTLGRTGARAGETAKDGGTGALRRAAPDEVGGIERSDVPQEYREQVGRYFRP